MSRKIAFAQPQVTLCAIHSGLDHYVHHCIINRAVIRDTQIQTRFHEPQRVTPRSDQSGRWDGVGSTV